MAHRPLAETPQEQWANTVPALALVTQRHTAALNALSQAFDDRRPLAILTGEGKFEANHVVSAFLGSLDPDIATVRLSRPYPDALSGMREITRAVGFDPKDLSLADLGNILEMFLSFQRKHRRRTLLCVEQCDLQPRWLLDQVRALVDLEAREKFGLLIVLAGRRQLRELVCREPLAGVALNAGRAINLMPFSVAETTEFIRQRVRASGANDISALFEFDAVGAIHELSGGVPDLVGTLCFKCLQIASQRDAGPVTETLVRDAANRLWQKPGVEARGPYHELPTVESLASYRGKLTAIRDRRILHEISLKPGRYLVGRAEFANLRLDSPLVSRRHALFIREDDTLRVLDLGSTNGTCVNGLRLNAETVVDFGDVITIADCRIEYAAD